MDQHLLAFNPMRSPLGGLCIIRTCKPVSIFEIHEGHIHVKDKTYKHKSYYNTDNHKEEHYTLSVHHMFVESILSREELSGDFVDKYLDDAWHWYMAYLQWSDKKD